MTVGFVIPAASSQESLSGKKALRNNNGENNFFALLEGALAKGGTGPRSFLEVPTKLPMESSPYSPGLTGQPESDEGGRPSGEDGKNLNDLFPEHLFEGGIPDAFLQGWGELTPAEKEPSSFFLSGVAEGIAEADLSFSGDLQEKASREMKHAVGGLMQFIAPGVKGDIALEPAAKGGFPLPEVAPLVLSHLKDGVSDVLNSSIMQDIQEYPGGALLKEAAALDPFLSRMEIFYKAFSGKEEGDPGTGFTGEGLKGEKEQQSAFEPAVVKNSSFPAEGQHFSLINGRTATDVARNVYRQPAENPQLYSRQVMEQIIERIDLLARPGEQEMRVRLQPEFLGEVLIRVKRIRGILSAEIVTGHLAVKEMLEGQLETLRQRFLQMDLNVEQFNVLVRDGGQEGFSFKRGFGADEIAQDHGPCRASAAGDEDLFLYGTLGDVGRVDCLV